MTDDSRIPEEAEIPSAFDDAQEARVQALWQARVLLPKSHRTVGDLTVLATFILDGIEEAFLEEAEVDTGGITVNVTGGCTGDSKTCACKIASTFRGGEQDLPEGWSIPPAEGVSLDLGGYPDATRPQPPVATSDELIRHAQKQGVSHRDAYSYFEDQGYDMSGVEDFEFDSTNYTDHTPISDREGN